MSTTTNDSSDTMPQLAEKDTYAELTESQKRVVDELADDPTAQNTQIAERASVSRSTVYNVKEKYGHIVEQQLNRRGRDPGEERTEGDPFPELAERAKGAQTILDRPVQDDDDGDAQREAADALVTVELNRSAVRAVLTRECDERVRAAVVEALFNRAFTGDES